MSEETILPFPRRRRSPDVTREMAAKIKNPKSTRWSYELKSAHYSEPKPTSAA